MPKATIKKPWTMPYVDVSVAFGKDGKASNLDHPDLKAAALEMLVRGDSRNAVAKAVGWQYDHTCRFYDANREVIAEIRRRRVEQYSAEYERQALADASERIRKLVKLASRLEKRMDKLDLQDPDGRFSHTLSKEFRAVLGDIAAEVGGREAKRSDVTVNVDNRQLAVDVSGWTPEERRQVLTMALKALPSGE